MIRLPHPTPARPAPVPWRTALSVAALAVLATVSAARADTLDEIRARHRLLVGIDLRLPPYGTRDSALLPTGSEVESARLLADDLGVRLDVVPVTEANRIPMLRARKVDLVMSALTVAEARRTAVDVSIPYGIVSVICAAPEGVDIGSAEDLAGKTVAVARGTGADADATRLAKADGRIGIVRFDDVASLVTALASGQQTVAISAPAQMRDADRRGAKLVQKFVIRADGYAVGIRKGDAALRKAVDDWIERDLADGKLRRVFAKWHEAELPAVMPKEEGTRPPPAAVTAPRAPRP